MCELSQLLPVCQCLFFFLQCFSYFSNKGASLGLQKPLHMPLTYLGLQMWTTMSGLLVKMGVSLTSGLILLISVSQVAGITVISHHHPASTPFNLRKAWTWAGSMALALEHLLCKGKDLSSNPVCSLLGPPPLLTGLSHWASCFHDTATSLHQAWQTPHFWT
jgi:hypothetical protein